MGTLEIPQGLTVKTRWRLEPEPTKASLPAMTLDQDPRWVSYQTPYHPKGFRMVHAYVRFFFPVELQDPSISDQWLRPSDPGTKFTNETLGFISDIGIPMLDNYFPESSSGDHPKVIAACRKQKEDLAKGTVNLDESSGAYETKVLCMSLALSLEIKKQLPPGGVDWLFLRAQAKHIQDDRLSLDATILDEHGDVVALSNQLCQIVDFRRAKRNKQKL